ncbi:hypothetical protein [Longimicrobium sp.]|uniref:hypothetical protein n=1 Tax=Longimicrobium sp. TaxID=2029185 RepID=UPI003B3BA712
MFIELLVVPDSISSGLWPPTGDDLKAAAAILTLLFGGGVITNAVARWRERRQQKRVAEKLPVGDFLPETVTAALRYYVEHEVSAIDPAGREKDRANLGPREPLFRLLDRTLYDTHEKQFLLLLADSGMGKTTALLNYYAHNARRKDSHPIVIFSLRSKGVNERIASVANKATTVLLLDALDEDPTAVADHTGRVHSLMESAHEFRAVVISCRSQFFLSAEEITKETGIARLHHRGLGETAEYLLLKFYLCPFSDDQVSAFLSKRYPFPRWGARKRARAAVKRVRDLTARPMLLAYIDDLTHGGRNITSLAEAYSEIVGQWIEREKPLVQDSASLLEFSKKLAVDLYTRREERSGEQAPAREIFALAQHWNIPLERWQLTGRSLLTRDAADQFRFAHRSILEYLFVRSLIEGDSQCATVIWTDQMYVFFLEMLDVSAVPAFDSRTFLRRIRDVLDTLLTVALAKRLNTAIPLVLLDQCFRTLLYVLAEMQYKTDHVTPSYLFDTEVDVLVAKSHVKPLIQLVFAEHGRDLPRVSIACIVPDQSRKGFTLTARGGTNNLYLGMSEKEVGALLRAAKVFEWDAPQPQTFVIHGTQQECTICLPFSSPRLSFGLVAVIHFTATINGTEGVDHLLDHFRSWMDFYHHLPNVLGRMRRKLWGFNVAVSRQPEFGTFSKQSAHAAGDTAKP